MNTALRTFFRYALTMLLVPLALLTCLSGVVSAVDQTRATQPARAVTAERTRASAKSPPRVVREIESSRTADSSTYVLSDGSRRSEIYSRPIRYRDRGAWRQVDPTLVPDGASGRFRAKSTAYSEVFSAGETGTPVSVAGAGWSLGMRLVGGNADGLAVLGDTAVFPLAQTDTRLTYEARADGVKETLVLSSPKAPDTFTFFLKLDGLTIHAEPCGGGYVLYRSGRLIGRMEPLSVFDSGPGQAGHPGTRCEAASMTVVPTAGGAYVTYRLPRLWLDDPMRMYPVYVDPAVTFAGPADTRNDTYVSQAGGTHYAENHLDASLFSAGDLRRALVNFNLNSVPRGSTINSALLQMYLWQNSSGGNFTMNCDPVAGSWNYAATWANTFGNKSLSRASGGDWITIAPGANRYVTWNMTCAVQNWFSGTMPNNGFVVSANNESAVSQHSFWSSEYTTFTSRQPHLVVDYTPPSVTVDPLAPSYRAGDTVRVTMHAQSRSASGLQLKIEGQMPSGGSCVRAHFAFTAAPPGGEWVSVPVQGGYISYNRTDAVAQAPEAGIIPDLSACSTAGRADGRDVTFVYRIGAGHGDVQNNRVSTLAPDWQTAWQDQGVTYSVLPDTAKVSATTTAGPEWFVQADTNADGLPDSRDDSADAGRGSVTLRWDPVPCALGYNVYLHDGNQFRWVDSTPATLWSSSGKCLYPSDSAIASLPAGSLANVYATKNGLDLRDDPRPLYAKTPGSALDDTVGYAFKIVPFNSAGAPAFSDSTTVTVALEGRTRHLAEAPRHPLFELGELFGHAARARLDDSSVQLDVTDLSLPSLGPDVSLARHYSSAETTSQRFAPGWRFAFERSVVASGPTTAIYTDETGDRHTFVATGGTWIAPSGDYDRLAGSAASGWTLTRKDRTAETFDSQGRLISEMDSDGNSVCYDWASDSLTMRDSKDVWLLHERRIVVQFSAGKVVSATLHTSDGDRAVRYSQTPTSAVVTTFPDTSAEGTVVYGYRDGRVASLAIPGFGPVPGAPALWAVAYDIPAVSLRLENVSGDATPAMRRDFMIDTSSRTATTTLAGGLTQTIRWNPVGQETRRSEPATLSVTARCYDALGNEIGKTSPSGRATRSFYDARGNMLAFADEGGRLTSYAYAGDLCVQEVDPRGSICSRRFDDRGHLVAESKTRDESGTASLASYRYAPDDGRLLAESVSVDAQTQDLTEYGDYADCGEAQTLTRKAIALSPGATPVDVVTRRSFDGLGRLLEETDALGVVVARCSYDEAGRLAESLDARGALSHARYNSVGALSEIWRSHPGTSAVAGRFTYTYDGAGHLLQEVLKATDGSTIATTTHSYDSAGREIKTDDTQVPGAAVATYDSQGHLDRIWGEGSDSSNVSASTRIGYNAEGEQTSLSDPGSSHASAQVTYNADGSVQGASEAAGADTSYIYNDSGDAIAQQKASDAGTATTVFSVDLNGQVTGETSLFDGSAVRHEYDLRGQETATSLNSQPPSSVVRNALGWELESIAFDGVITRTSYDASGRITASRRGVDCSQYSYGPGGDLASVSFPDGGRISYSYDQFARVIQERHADRSGTETKQVLTSYDDAGRLRSSQDAISGLTRDYSYAASGTVTVAERRPGGATVTTELTSAGQQRSLVATVSSARLGWSVVATDLAGRVTDATSTTLPTNRRRLFDEAGRLVADAIGSYSYSSTGSKRSESLAFTAWPVAEQNAYAYDASGRLSSARVASTTTSYEYVSGSKALARCTSSGVATAFAYDGGGRLESARSSAGARLYATDSLGRRVRSGTSANPSETVLTWAGERLATVSGPGTVSQFTYDGTGLRVLAVSARGSAVTTAAFTYDGLQLLGVHSQCSSGDQFRIDYFYDSTGVSAGVYRSGAATPVAFSIATSDRGDVRELRDSAGEPFALYSYDAFGNPLRRLTRATSRVASSVASAVAARQPLRYAGYQYDSDTGLYYCAARYYDPAVAAFISGDVERADGEQSASQYCSGDPIGNVDTTGLAAKAKLKQGALTSRDYDDVREKVVYNSFYVLNHAKGYAPDNHTQGYKGAPDGYVDCSGLVTYVMWRAGVFAQSSIYNWNSRAIYDNALTKSTHPNDNFFDTSKRAKWRIGDIVQSDAPNNHVAVIVRDSPDPYIAESSPTYRGPAIHKLAKRKKTWHYQHSGRFFSLRKS